MRFKRRKRLKYSPNWSYYYVYLSPKTAFKSGKYGNYGGTHRHYVHDFNDQVKNTQKFEGSIVTCRYSFIATTKCSNVFVLIEESEPHSLIPLQAVWIRLKLRSLNFALCPKKRNFSRRPAGNCAFQNLFFITYTPLSSETDYKSALRISVFFINGCCHF